MGDDVHDLENEYTIGDQIIDIMLAMKARGHQMRELWYAGFLSRQESEDLQTALDKITGPELPTSRPPAPHPRPADAVNQVTGRLDDHKFTRRANLYGICDVCGGDAEVHAKVLWDLLDALYTACQVDQPDEGKHELAVRLMRMMRP